MKTSEVLKMYTKTLHRFLDEKPKFLKPKAFQLKTLVSDKTNLTCSLKAQVFELI